MKEEVESIIVHSLKIRKLMYCDCTVNFSNGTYGKASIRTQF